MARLLALLRDIDISKRQLRRLLIAGQDGSVTEARDVLRAGLETARCISVDDTGARHAGANGTCTQISNRDRIWFGTTASKSRLNFLGLLRAGHVDYVVDDAALDYMRGRALAGPLIARLADGAMRHFTSPRTGRCIWSGSASRASKAASHVPASPPSARSGAASQPTACCAMPSSSGCSSLGDPI